MIYRRNEKGRYEGVTDKGEIIAFEDASEMIACAELRDYLHRLVGDEEVVEFDASAVSSSSIGVACNSSPTSHVPGKAVKIRVHKGKFAYDGEKLIKEKTA